MAYDLKDSVISSVNCSGGTGEDDLPLEQVTFCHGEVHWTYTPTDPRGGGKKMADIKAAWSSRENKPL